VMGLFRLWWIAAGSEPGDGAYVRYPHADLLDILALESHRHEATVIGEDLGTVEDSAREALADSKVLSYRLLWFEEDDPSEWPECAMAAVTTHDLPTVAGLWDGSDLEAQRTLGMQPNEQGTQGIRDSLAERGHLAASADADQAVDAAYTLLARAPCVMLCATLEDALAEPQRPNIPGADDGRPNWCIALPMPIEEMFAEPLASGVARTLQNAIAPPT
jgi:4-alpha-glucanotransferase